MGDEAGSKLLPHATDAYEIVTGEMLDQFRGKQISTLAKVLEAQEDYLKLSCSHGNFDL